MECGLARAERASLACWVLGALWQFDSLGEVSRARGGYYIFCRMHPEGSALLSSPNIGARGGMGLCDLAPEHGPAAGSSARLKARPQKLATTTMATTPTKFEAVSTLSSTLRLHVSATGGDIQVRITWGITNYNYAARFC